MGPFMTSVDMSGASLTVMRLPQGKVSPCLRLPGVGVRARPARMAYHFLLQLMYWLCFCCSIRHTVDASRKCLDCKCGCSMGLRRTVGIGMSWLGTFCIRSSRGMGYVSAGDCQRHLLFQVGLFSSCLGFCEVASI